MADKYDPTKKSGKLLPQSKTTLKQRMSKVDALFDKKNNWKKLNPKIRSKIRKAKYDKLSPKQKKQLASYKTIGEAAMFIGSLTPVGKTAVVTSGVAKAGSKIIPKLTDAYKKWRKTTGEVTKKNLKKTDKPKNESNKKFKERVLKIATPKTKLTKEQMVQAISNKSKPRLPKDQLPKPPSGKVPAVRTSGKQVPSGGKQVPAIRASNKLSTVTNAKIARLGGLKNVKKGTALWKKLVGAGIIAGSVAIPLLTDSKKTADATLKNKKRKSVLGGRGRINEKPGERAKATIPTIKDQEEINKNVTADPKVTAKLKGRAKSLPAYFNNPIFKKLMDERGGREKFEPDNMWGKMSRFGRIGNDSTNQIMTEAAYKDLDEIENKTAAEEKLQSELYPIAMKRKGGGKVRKKKKKTKQGYKSRKNESIAMRVKKKRTKKQLKSSRNESYGKWGKGKGKGKVNKVFRRGGGKALRGFGNATYSNKLY